MSNYIFGSSESILPNWTVYRIWNHFLDCTLDCNLLKDCSPEISHLEIAYKQIVYVDDIIEIYEEITAKDISQQQS